MDSILIVDDEPLARKGVALRLQKFEDIEVVGECGDGATAVEKILSLSPDVVFLDVQMPEMDGFDVLRALPAENVPAIIFLTAHEQHALQAFEVHSIDYLLKPIQPERLSEAVHKIMEKEKAKAGRAHDKKLGLEDQVFVKDGERCWFVGLASVRMFESDGNYIKVYFDNNKPMIHKSLNALDEKLDERAFFRASRKHIINLSWVEGIETWFNGGLMVKLRGGDKVEVSRRQAAKFKDMMSL